MKRGEELKPLSWDHHHGLVLSFRLKRGLNKNIAGELMVDYINQAWENTLLPHFKKEEDLLAVALEKYSGSADVLIKKLKRDHQFFRNLMRKINFKDVNLKSCLQEFAESLERHIRFEERDFFPAVENQVPPRQLDLIGRSLQALHQAAEMSWTPEFWR